MEPTPAADSFAYRHSVADVMSSPPATIAPDASLVDAARVMRARRISSLVVVDEAGRPAAIVTERDILTAIADRGGDGLALPVTSFASSPVAGVSAEALLHVAIARMDRLGLRHLAVTEPGTGRLVGMLSARALLRQRAQKALMLGDEIATTERVEDMAALYRRLPEVAQALRAEGMTAIEVAGLLSSVLRDISARAAALAEAAMARPAPAAWCYLVLGSGGRGESLLAADQDNALVHAAATDDDPCYEEIGKRASDYLDRVGIPYCKGGVMAMNRECRHSLEGWRQRIAGWVARPEGVNLLNADIFYDFRPVHGDYGLAALLRDLALEAARSRPFLALLGAQLGDMGTPLGLFGGFKTEAGRVDLKKGGLLPLVSAARVLALRDGSSALDTPGRLQAAVAAGHLNAEDAAGFRDAHELLLRLVLEQQIEDVRAGISPSPRVEIKRLDGLTRHRLREALKRIQLIDFTVRDALAGR